MSRRIEIELTSERSDGTWTWRAAGAKQPRGVLDGTLLAEGAKAGDVLRAEAEFEIDGITIVAVLRPKEDSRAEPQTIEVLGPARPEPPGVTTQLAGRAGGERGPGRRPRDGEDRRGQGGSRDGPDRRGRDGPSGGPDRRREAGARDGTESHSGGRDGSDGRDASEGRGTSDGRGTPDRRRPPRERATGGPRGDEGAPSRGRPARPGRRDGASGRAGGDGPATADRDGDALQETGTESPGPGGSRRAPARRREGTSRPPRDGGRDRDSGRDRESGRDGESERHRRLNPGRAHRQAVLGALPPEQQPVAEQVLRGGIPAVRTALHLEREKALAEGRPAPNSEELIALAEQLLPRLKAAEWRDRAEAASKAVDSISLRDLRSVVAGADVARDDDTRALAATLREALERRLDALRMQWLDEIGAYLDDGRVVRALRLSARPPEPSARLSPELSTRLIEAAGTSMGAETPNDTWLAVLEAAAESPVRREVNPAALPTAATPELRRAAHQHSGRIPALAAMLGVSIPPPPGPPRPVPQRARSGSPRPERRPPRHTRDPARTAAADDDDKTAPAELTDEATTTAAPVQAPANSTAVGRADADARTAEPTAAEPIDADAGVGPADTDAPTAEPTPARPTAAEPSDGDAGVGRADADARTAEPAPAKPMTADAPAESPMNEPAAARPSDAAVVTSEPIEAESPVTEAPDDAGGTEPVTDGAATSEAAPRVKTVEQPEPVVAEDSEGVVPTTEPTAEEPSPAAAEQGFETTEGDPTETSPVGQAAEVAQGPDPVAASTENGDNAVVVEELG